MSCSRDSGTLTGADAKAGARWQGYLSPVRLEGGVRGEERTKRATTRASTGSGRRPGSYSLPARTDPGSVSARRPAPRRVPSPAARTSRLRSARGGGGAAGWGGPPRRAGTRGRREGAPRGGARGARGAGPRRARGLGVCAAPGPPESPRSSCCETAFFAAVTVVSSAKQVLPGLDAVTVRSGNSQSQFKEGESCSGMGRARERLGHCGEKNHGKLGYSPGWLGLGCLVKRVIFQSYKLGYSAFGSRESEKKIFHFFGPLLCSV